jgi:hypothetical protein
MEELRRAATDRLPPPVSEHFNQGERKRPARGL